MTKFDCPQNFRKGIQSSMKNSRFPRLGIALLALLGFCVAALMATGQQGSEPAASGEVTPLPLDRVVQNLEARNAQRTAALEQFEGKRVYRMEYRGFPGNREAEMVVKVSFRAPNRKEFDVVSETGSKFIIDHVFKKLLEGEQEAAKGDNRQQSALTSENYSFELAGYEASPEGDQYVLNLLPKTKNKFLYRGKIWVDAKDFAVVRIEAEPAKNPSMWIKQTDIAHKYVKVDDFWLPAENHTESVIRLGGKATLLIEYRDYKIIKASPLNADRRSRQADDSAFVDVVSASAVQTQVSKPAQ
jgi:outer membrane lipoprotein-sorting protein